MNLSSFPHVRRGFTLIELLTVIAIIGILAAIIVPVVGKVRSTARTSQSSSNLRQIGLGVQLYTQDNRGLLPASGTGQSGASTDPALNPSGGFWMVELNPYVGRSRQTGNSDVSEFFIDPVYAAMLGATPPANRGGYSMNRRMQHTLGIRNGGDRATYGNYRVRSDRFTQPSRTVFAGPGYFEAFDPSSSGVVASERLSQSVTTAVPHNLRIGAGGDGFGGSSALYLFLDGHVENLSPDRAAERLKQIQ